MNRETTDSMRLLREFQTLRAFGLWTLPEGPLGSAMRAYVAAAARAEEEAVLVAMDDEDEP